jgi:plasmid stabilization system protein ParE
LPHILSPIGAIVAMGKSQMEPMVGFGKEMFMPVGDKSKYTDKQKRRAEHIEEGYEKRGRSKKTAERIAWATVNKESGGGKKSGSGRGKMGNRSASTKGGHIGGSSQSFAKRSAAGKKAARTRAQHGR